MTLVDDHELWCRALSSVDPIEVPPEVWQRVARDTQGAQDYVTSLVQSLTELLRGVSSLQVSSHGLAETSTTRKLPAAFETTSGKQHIDSLTSWLSLEPMEAVDLTIHALSSIDTTTPTTTTSKLPSLLGTEALLLLVLDYYGQQRLARLGILTELLLRHSTTSLETLNQDMTFCQAPCGVMARLLYAASTTRDYLDLEAAPPKVSHLLRQQAMQQRHQALQALLALLYISTPLQTQEWCLLVLALNDGDQCELGAPLTTTPPLDSMVLLFGLQLQPDNLHELHSMATYCQTMLETQHCRHVTYASSQQQQQQQQQQQLKMIQAPASIPLLVLGLLLLRHRDKQNAMQILELANNAGCFEYLLYCMQQLTNQDEDSNQEQCYRNTPFYDWMFAPDTTPRRTLASEQEDTLPPLVVIGTSLGLDVIAALVETLDNCLDHDDDDNNNNNCQTLATMAATIYHNRTALCRDFWDHTPAPMAQLVNACPPNIMQHLMAALCYNEETVQRTLDMVIPDSLTPLQIMANYGPEAVRRILRHASILWQTQNANLQIIMDISANLAENNVEWSLMVAQQLDPVKHIRKAFGSSCALSAARLLHALVHTMPAIVFATNHASTAYLNTMVQATSIALHSLTSIFDYSRQQQPQVPYTTARNILEAAATLLQTLRQVTRLHRSAQIREEARQGLVSTLETLRTSTALGMALAYFCAAPVSLSLALWLEQAVQEARLLQLATDEYATDANDEDKHTWKSFFTPTLSVQTLVQERLQDMHLIPIDMAAVHARGWSTDGSPVSTAASAVALLEQWAALDTEHVVARLLQSQSTRPPVAMAPLWPTHWSTLHLLVSLFHAPDDMPNPIRLLAVAPQYSPGDALYKTMTKVFGKVITVLEEEKEDPILYKGVQFIQLLSSIDQRDPTLAKAFWDYNDGAIGKDLLKIVAGAQKKGMRGVRERYAAEILSLIHLAEPISQELCQQLGFFATTRDSGVVYSVLSKQSVQTLTEMVASDRDPQALQSVIQSPQFFKDQLFNFGDNVSSLCKTSSNFHDVATDGVKSQLNLVSPAVFAEAFSEGNTLNPYNVKAAAQLVYSLDQQESDPAHVAAAIEEMFSSIALVKTHAETVSAITSAFQVWIDKESNHISGDELKEQWLLLMKTIFDLAELKCDVEQGYAGISEDIIPVIDALSSMLLLVTSLSSGEASVYAANAEKLVEVMGIIVLGNSSLHEKDKASSLDNLLAVATLVVQGSPVNIDFAKFMVIMRQALLGRSSSSLNSCISLLVAFLGNEALTKDRKNSVAFSEALLESGILVHLVEEASQASSRAINDKDGFDENEVENVDCLFTLLLAAANAGEQEHSYVCLFAQANLRKLLLVNPLFAQAVSRWVGDDDKSRYRGYIKSSTKRTTERGIGSNAVFLSGRDDKVHRVWCLAIHLVTTLLRIACIHGKGREYTKLAHDFVLQYDSVLRSCIIYCSSVGNGSVLTHNLIDEASEILALLQELKGKSGPYLETVLSSVGSFSDFLGAIGTARFLFKLVRENEAANQEEDGPFENIQEFHPALAGGVANARFEAIRYAHYARNAYAMVTSDDHNLFSKVRSPIPGGNELEVTCYRAINNCFSEAIEAAVARCLRQGYLLLLKNHPASTRFTSFSKDENVHLHPLTIVKNGTFITYSFEETQRFARVVSCDTIRRTWQCNTIDPINREISKEVVTVSADDLTGVEDILKRKTLFQFIPAPDDATELDKRGPANVGHLILALRWCREEQTRAAEGLAESTAALLATELALHKEIGNVSRAPDSVCRRMSHQLTDLFHPDSKFGVNIEDTFGGTVRAICTQICAQENPVAI